MNVEYVMVKYIDKIQQDATDAGIYLPQNYSTCFRCLSHPHQEYIKL